MQQVTIAYPDEGAHKRFHTSFKAEGYPEVICTKVRAVGWASQLMNFIF